MGMDIGAAMTLLEDKKVENNPEDKRREDMVHVGGNEEEEDPEGHSQELSLEGILDGAGGYNLHAFEKDASVAVP